MALLSENPFHYSIATRVRNPYFQRFLAPQPGERVLDVGCGVGYYTVLLGECGANLWGMDADLDAVLVARRLYGDRFLVGRAEELPFADNSFDKLLCSEVLEHIHDDGAAVAELRRVAKEGAIIVVTVPSPDGVFGVRIKSICHGAASSLSDGKSWEEHRRDGYTCEELCLLLERRGISIQEVRYTLVFVAELLMGVTKLAFSAISGRKHLGSQMEVLEVSESLPLKLYRRAFPVLVLMAHIEDLILARFLRGHMVIVRATVRKAERCS